MKNQSIEDIVKQSDKNFSDKQANSIVKRYNELIKEGVNEYKIYKKTKQREMDISWKIRNKEKNRNKT